MFLEHKNYLNLLKQASFFTCSIFALGTWMLLSSKEDS